MLLAQLASPLSALRLSLHVVAAAVWVGGQLTLAGLVPTVRRLGPTGPRQVARAFSRLSWPAYLVLLGTGAWNAVAVDAGQGRAWQLVLGAKVGVVLLAGLAAWRHGRAQGARGLAIWGALAGLASLAALVLGVLLAG